MGLGGWGAWTSIPGVSGTVLAGVTSLPRVPVVMRGLGQFSVHKEQTLDVPLYDQDLFELVSASLGLRVAGAGGLLAVYLGSNLGTAVFLSVPLFYPYKLRRQRRPAGYPAARRTLCLLRV